MQEAGSKRQQGNTILQLDPAQASEEAELEFVLGYLAPLTVSERFELLFRRWREIQEMLQRYGHRKPAEIVGGTGFPGQETVCGKR